MKALVVDDDRNTVEVILKSIHWELLGIEQVYHAYETAGAKAILQKEAVDIVICDIEMPMGSGIDLIIWERERGKNSEFLFLTCHESFEFASDAIRYHAAAYLVKPFVPERMEGELNKLVNRLNRERMLEESGKYRELWVNGREYLENLFWEEVLSGRIPASEDGIALEIEKRKLAIERDDLYILLFISAKKYSCAWEEWEEGLLEYALEKLEGEVVHEENGRRGLLREDSETAFYMEEVIRENETVDLEEKCREFIRLSDLWLGCEITCYIGNPCAIRELSGVKNRILECDADNMIYRGRTLREGQWLLPQKQDRPMIDLGKMEEHLAAGNQVRILNDLKAALEDMTAKKAVNAATLRAMQMNLTQIVYVYLYRNGIQADELFADALSVRLRNNAVHSVVDMLKWQNSLIRKTVEYVEEVQKSDNIILKVKVFLKEHYREDIGRTEAAAEVYLTPEYLAKLFKKETGVNLKEYVHQLRIREAKLLLAEGTRVSEVAQRVGFDNFSYFSTVFKRVTGQSPNEYKRLEKGQEREGKGCNKGND